MLKLPDVTLVIAETRAHALARRTLADLVSRVEFGGITIYSNDCASIPVPGATYIPVTDWPNKIASGHFYYTAAARDIKTSHALLMEWDAGLNDPDMWSDEFLDFDFLGAPWPGRGHSRVRDGCNVGNGGFMLLSKPLIDFLYATRSQYHIATDYHLACDHRRQIERAGGFKWAPDTTAVKFSFEGWNGGPPNCDVKPRSFGYHGVFNWPIMLGREETTARAKMLIENDFTRDSKLPLLLRGAPWLRAEIPVARPLSRMDLLRQQRGRALMYARSVQATRGLKA